MKPIKLSRRIALSFFLLFLVFSLVLSILFYTLNRRSMLRVYEDQLLTHAISIADAIDGLTISGEDLSGKSGQIPGQGQSHGGLGRGMHMGPRSAYLDLINEIAMSDIWIVDESARSVTVGMSQRPINYTELNPQAQALLEDVFAGKALTSRAFSEQLDRASLSAGAPVYDRDGQVIAAVLLHDSYSDLSQSLNEILGIFGMSLLIALFVALILTTLLSRRISRPVAQMGETATRLASGDYDARSGISQSDEIGALARNIDKLAEHLVEAKREQEQQEESKRAFLASVSHELRTPVAVMRSSLEALRDGVVSEPERRQEYYDDLLVESRHLEGHINDLLELSRLDSAEFKFEKSEVNVPDVLEDAVRGKRRQAEQLGLSLTYSDDVRQYAYMGDYNRLYQLFGILLDNALRYADAGTSVSISSQLTETRQLEVLVHDYGVVIPSEALPHIFERFYRINADDSLGSGLGLAIAAALADRHDIAIEVESSDRAGTTFRLLFSAPLAEH